MKGGFIYMMLQFWSLSATQWVLVQKFNNMKGGFIYCDVAVLIFVCYPMGIRM